MKIIIIILADNVEIINVKSLESLDRIKPV